LKIENYFYGTLGISFSVLLSGAVCFLDGGDAPANFVLALFVVGQGISSGAVLGAF
jgi:hypothetical protein